MGRTEGSGVGPATRMFAQNTLAKGLKVLTGIKFERWTINIIVLRALVHRCPTALISKAMVFLPYCRDGTPATCNILTTGVTILVERKGK